MEKKQITLERPVSASGRTLIPVVQTSIFSWPDQEGTTFFSLKKPLYILVSSAGLPLSALETSGKSVSIDEIAAKFPELKEKLNQLQG